MMAYLSMMAPRLTELRRVLKPTGSIYLHCDPTASHYLKMLMDSIFGLNNFRSEIIWRRTNSHNKLTQQYGPIHDTILFYSKMDDFKFHPGTRPYTKAYINDRFKLPDEKGRHQLNYLTGPGIRKKQSGEPWRGFNPTAAGRHWAIPRSLRIYLPEGGKGMSSHEMLESLYEQRLVVFPQRDGGQPMYKQFIGPGVPYQDIWAYQPNTHGVLHDTDECIDEDVKYLENEDEKLGFETQKPVGLLARMIETSSDEGDIILDPFCGCGTAIVAAQNLKRHWIGIDITQAAIVVIKKRLKDKKYKVIGEPGTVPDAKALAIQDPFQFQWWALDLVNARPTEQKKGSDRGIDGRLYFHDEQREGKTKQIIISVKSGEHISPVFVRDLAGVIQREKAEIGVLITMEEPTRQMRSEAASAGFYHSPWTNESYPRLQLLTIAELLEGTGIKYPQYSKNVTFKENQKPKIKTAKHLKLL